jgi:hypothetical protein
LISPLGYGAEQFSDLRAMRTRLFYQGTVTSRSALKCEKFEATTKFEAHYGANAMQSVEIVRRHAPRFQNSQARLEHHPLAYPLSALELWRKRAC